MTRAMPLALIAGLALPGASAAQAARKYDVRSGIVTFETVTTVGKAESRKKSVVTFDDWGAREKRDTYGKDGIAETFLCDGKNQIAIQPAQKTAYVVGTCSRGTEMRFDWTEIPDQDRKQGKARRLSPMTVAGKKCEAFEIEDGRSTSRFAGFGKVTLFTEVENAGSKTVSRAVRFEENVAIPADDLRIPAGFTTKKWP